MAGPTDRITRTASLILAISVLLAGSSSAAAVDSSAIQGPPVGHRSARWAQRFDGSADLNDVATSIAVGPHGNRVYITGSSTTGPSGPEPYDSDYVTIAYSAVRGKRIWQARYNGPAESDDAAVAISVSPDGAQVFVTGTSDDAAGPLASHENSIATVAYDAASGDTLWSARSSGAAGEDLVAKGLVASPDGSAIYVAGDAESDADVDFVTEAYSTLGGSELWTARSFGSGSTEVVQGIDVAPDGSAVYVTGHSQTETAFDYATVAYKASDGAELWHASFDSHTHGADGALAVAANPGGSLVYVTGESASPPSGLFDYVTVAYDAATGAPVWTRRYRGPRRRDDIARDVSVAPDGAVVYVTGESVGRSGGFDYATLAYEARSGKKIWAARYAGPGGGDDTPCCVAVSPDGATVYVSGTAVYRNHAGNTLDYGTTAYAAGTGSLLWVARYDGPVAGHDHAHALAVASDGSNVFVAGDSPGRLTGLGPLDYATVAY